MSGPGDGDPRHDDVDRGPDTGARPGGEDARREAARRRRRAEVFGEVLPETTTDDRPETGDGVSDDWWRGQVPPHHG